jgi:hypothetical protein
MMCVLYCRSDEHIEGGGDEHRSGKTEQEQQDEVVGHKSKHSQRSRNLSSINQSHAAVPLQKEVDKTVVADLGFPIIHSVLLAVSLHVLLPE